MTLVPSSSRGSGGGGGTVDSVTAADTSIVVSGTATDPEIATATLDVIATDHPPAAAWSNNAKKITGLANGSASTDAAAFGQLPVRAHYAGVTSNPPGTSSTSAVMAGLAGTITPSASGVVLVTIAGYCETSAPGSDAGEVVLAYGTGTAPINGAAASGTLFGPGAAGIQGGAVANIPFSLTGIITGLPLATAYWLDLQYNALIGGTFTITRVCVSAAEL